MQLHIKLV